MHATEAPFAEVPQPRERFELGRRATLLGSLSLALGPGRGGAARSGSFDRVRRLAALEETLAATLFDRGREGIAPTEAAEDLMPVAEELEAVMARFANAAEGLRACRRWPGAYHLSVRRRGGRGGPDAR